MNTQSRWPFSAHRPSASRTTGSSSCSSSSRTSSRVVVRPPEPRAEGDRVGPPRRVEDAVQSLRPEPAGAAVVARPRDDLEQPLLENEAQRGGHARVDVAGARAHGRLRREARRARHPRRAADDEHAAGAVLVVPGGSPGNELEDGGAHAAVQRLAALEADVGHLDLAGVKAPGADGVTHLRRVERHRRGRADGDACDLSGGGVDARRHVDGDGLIAEGVDQLDRVGRLPSRRPRETGAEQGVDDHVGGTRFGDERETQLPGTP